jgi:hypothetical protein
VSSDEGEDVFFANAVDALPVSIMPTRTLEAIQQPPFFHPAGNLAMILTEAELQISHCVTVAHLSGDAERQLSVWTCNSV